MMMNMPDFFECVACKARVRLVRDPKNRFQAAATWSKDFKEHEVLP